MKREEIRDKIPNITDEQLKAILDLNGRDVEKVKEKVTALSAELDEKEQSYNDLSAEFEKFKSGAASAEEFKTKYEQLVNDVAAKEKAAKEEAEQKEKAERIAARFNAVLGDKKFSHEAIKKDYIAKFTEALENKDNEGKSDSDIFHDLTKDDAAAFVGVQRFALKGANKSATGGIKSKEEILSIKNNSERRQEMLNALQTDPHFFD